MTAAISADLGVKDIALSALQAFDRFFEIFPINDAHDRNGFLIDPIKKPVIVNPQPIERKSKPFEFLLQRRGWKENLSKAHDALDNPGMDNPRKRSDVSYGRLGQLNGEVAHLNPYRERR
jgi:hypothetical protein